MKSINNEFFNDSKIQFSICHKCKLCLNRAFCHGKSKKTAHKPLEESTYS